LTFHTKLWTSKHKKLIKIRKRFIIKFIINSNYDLKKIPCHIMTLIWKHPKFPTLIKNCLITYQTYQKLVYQTNQELILLYNCDFQFIWKFQKIIFMIVDTLLVLWCFWNTKIGGWWFFDLKIIEIDNSLIKKILNN
jgi:hypothetical protein